MQWQLVTGWYFDNHVTGSKPVRCTTQRVQIFSLVSTLCCKMTLLPLKVTPLKREQQLRVLDHHLKITAVQNALKGIYCHFAQKEAEIAIIPQNYHLHVSRATFVDLCSHSLVAAHYSHGPF